MVDNAVVRKGVDQRAGHSPRKGPRCRSTLGINRAILTALDLQDQHPPGRIDDDEINFAFLHDLELVAELAGSEPGVAVVDNAVVRTSARATLRSEGTEMSLNSTLGINRAIRSL